jgi:hypothetical protein
MPWVRQALWHFRGPGQGDSGPVLHLAVGPSGAGRCRATPRPALGGGPPPPLPPSHPWPGPPGPTAQQPGRLSHAPEAARRWPGAGRAPEAVRRKPWPPPAEACAGSRAREAVRRKPSLEAVRRKPCAAGDAVRRKPLAGSRAPEAVRWKPCAAGGGSRAPEAVRRKPCIGSRVRSCMRKVRTMPFKYV